MALNIKNRDVEKLAETVAAMTGESKTQAIRKALEERKERLSFHVARRDRRDDLRAFMEREVWPVVPPKELGKTLSRKQREQILGYGPEGV